MDTDRSMEGVEVQRASPTASPENDPWYIEEIASAHSSNDGSIHSTRAFRPFANHQLNVVLKYVDETVFPHMIGRSVTGRERDYEHRFKRDKKTEGRPSSPRVLTLRSSTAANSRVSPNRGASPKEAAAKGGRRGSSRIRMLVESNQKRTSHAISQLRAAMAEETSRVRVGRAHFSVVNGAEAQMSMKARRRHELEIDRIAAPSIMGSIWADMAVL